jgi:hypothetical protein
LFSGRSAHAAVRRALGFETSDKIIKALTIPEEDESGYISQVTCLWMLLLLVGLPFRVPLLAVRAPQLSEINVASFLFYSFAWM